MSRKEARDCVFKLIFEIPFYNNEYKERINLFFEANEISSKKINKSDREYIVFTTEKCFENLEMIDEQINANLKNWKLSRLDSVTTAILRLAVCEMNFVDDVPYQVAVNEAIEIAKKYGDEDTPSFVNGVLASVIEKSNN